MKGERRSKTNADVGSHPRQRRTRENVPAPPLPSVLTRSFSGASTSGPLLPKGIGWNSFHARNSGLGGLSFGEEVIRKMKEVC